MTTYVILSRFSPEAFQEPHEFKKLAEAVSAKIKSECSGIRWKDSYATLGRFDVVDHSRIRTFHHRGADFNAVKEFLGTL
jgi:uncharacterized protein with GYD domain